MDLFWRNASPVWVFGGGVGGWTEGKLNFVKHGGLVEIRETGKPEEDDNEENYFLIDRILRGMLLNSIFLVAYVGE